MSKKKIFLIVGRTCTGKSSLAREMCDRLGVKQVVSYATRPRRKSEKEGADHYFIKSHDVEKYQDQMAAYTKIGDYEYFTTYQTLDESDVYVIDPVGIRELKKRCGGKYDFVTIYIRVPRAKWQQLMKGRGVEKNRITQEDAQFTAYENDHGWDYHILNAAEFKDAADTMERIMRKELNI